METNAVIKVDHVSFTYQNQNRKVLNDISFSIPAGSITVVCGPTGSGKTTLIRLFNGLIPHFHEGSIQGDVIVDDIVVKKATIPRMAQVVGMVFQNPDNQLVASSCEREVAFGPENLGLPKNEIKSRMDEVISLLGLETLRDTSPAELSGGQKQKVAIAAALALRPKILVFDEPSSNLDPLSIQRLASIIQELNAKLGTTIIIVEHNLEAFLEIATHILCVKNGRVILHDKVQRAMRNDAFHELGVQIPIVCKIFKRLIDERLYHGDIPVDFITAIDYLKRIMGCA
nr:ABC transporter ATP-binding protein [Candidatus Sigynarchaeota archaeon]